MHLILQNMSGVGLKNEEKAVEYIPHKIHHVEFTFLTYIVLFIKMISLVFIKWLKSLIHGRTESHYFLLLLSEPQCLLEEI